VLLINIIQMMVLMSSTEKQGAMLEQNTKPQSDDDVNEQHRVTKRHVGTEYNTSVR
jgi:hypothetical protein